jgi:hypothetical protein
MVESGEGIVTSRQIFVKLVRVVDDEYDKV